MRITVGHAIKSFNSRSNSLREQCHFRNWELGFCGHGSGRDLTSQLYRDWALFRFPLLNLMVHKAISGILRETPLCHVCVALMQSSFLSRMCLAKSLKGDLFRLTCLMMFVWTWRNFNFFTAPQHWSSSKNKTRYARTHKPILNVTR